MFNHVNIDLPSLNKETIDGVRQMWPVDEMTVFNVTLGYKFKNDLKIGRAHV